MVSARLIIAPDLVATIAQASVDFTLDGRRLQDAFRSAIADRRGYCSLDVDHAGWKVLLDHLDKQTFYSRTLDEALA